MSIISCYEKIDGPRSSSIDRMWQRSYTRTFVVETSGPQVGSLQVRGASGIPAIGATYNNGLATNDPDYEYDNGSFVVSVEPSMDSGTGGIQWTVTVNYGPYQGFGANPLLWPIKVVFGGERTDRVIYFDWQGNPITNSAGDPFDPAVTIDDSRSTMIIMRNEAVSTYNNQVAGLYRDSVNMYSWNGFPEGTVKCGIISTSEPQFDSNNLLYYYTVTYPFMVNMDKWLVQVLDSGCNELTEPSPFCGYGGTGGSWWTEGQDIYSAFDWAWLGGTPGENTQGDPLKTRPIMDGGQQVSSPVPLDGCGQRLPTGGVPVAIPVNAYKVLDFSPLNINLTYRMGA